MSKVINVYHGYSSGFHTGTFFQVEGEDVLAGFPPKTEEEAERIAGEIATGIVYKYHPRDFWKISGEVIDEAPACTFTFEENYKTEQWQRMTLDEVKSVEVGQRIRVNGVETVVTGLYDREEDDYGFHIKDSVNTGFYAPIVTDCELDNPNNIFEKLSVEPSQPQSSDLDDAIDVFLEALREPLKDLLSSAKEQL